MTYLPQASTFNFRRLADGAIVALSPSGDFTFLKDMRARGDVYVITGPIFESKVETIGPNKVWVPSHLFKLVYDKSANKTWAHWIENSNTAKIAQPIDYAELARRTGMDFIPELIN